MQFKQVIGQEEVKQRLIELVNHNRLSHALLFLGKEGSGALPLAMAFSSYVSLLPVYNRGISSEASLFIENSGPAYPATAQEADVWMQSKPSFHKADKLIHPDIHFSYPVVLKKAGNAPVSSDYGMEWREFINQYPYGNVYDWLQFIGAENKQGNITAQECNEIIRKLSLKSFENGYKILLMWMPEYLGKEGNKLLKLIEEPPFDTLFILVAESENSILSTIISRCQLVKVPSLESEDIEKALVERNHLDRDKAKQVANTSNGNYREALQIVQHADEDYHNLLRDWLNATIKNNSLLQVKCIDEISQLGREKQKQFILYFTHLIEQAVRLTCFSSQQQALMMNSFSEPEKEFIPKIKKVITLEQLDAIANELDKASYYIERNAHAKILFHALTIKIFHIVKNNVRILA